VKDVLAERYQTLRKIYLFYSSGNSREQDIEMSLQEAWQFISDLDLGKTFTSKRELEQLFKKANVGAAIDMSGLDDSGGDDFSKDFGERTLNGTEFMQLLMHTAELKYRDKGEMLSIGEKLRRFVEKNLLPHASWSDAEEFKEIVYKSDVQTVLLPHRSVAAQAFEHYNAAADAKKGGQRKKEDKQTMRMETFVEIIHDLRIIDSVLTHEAVRQIFLKMQDCNSADMGGTRATFHEFLECLCAVGIFKIPAPYLPVHQRIDRFFRQTFTPMMTDIVKSSPSFRRK